MTSTTTPSFDQLTAWLNESAFHKVLGLTLESMDPADRSVVLRCAFGPNVDRGTGTGQYHGGVIASLIDIAGDFALIAVLGHGVPTINFRVDYLRPAVNGDLVARARVRKAGRTIAVVDVDVDDGGGRLVAVGRGCYGTQPG